MSGTRGSGQAWMWPGRWWLGLFCGLAITTPTNGVEYIAPPARRVPLYGRIQIGLRLDEPAPDLWVASPETLGARFVSPSGRIANVSAFRMQDFRIRQRRVGAPKEATESAGDSYYAVRFMPTELGRHQLEILRAGKAVLAGEFSCEPSDLPLPIRVSPSDPAYFERADGSPWLAVGENLCWPGPARMLDYEEWLSRLAEAGCNYCRVWMAPWSFAVEWGELGRYRLDRAAELDRVLELAQERGIYVVLCLDSFGSLTLEGAHWEENPYNAANDGPCGKASDFFSDGDAADFYRRRLRYLAARYGSYGNLLAWELFNEVDLTDDYDSAAVAEWHRRMARHLRSVDPYGHLITTSYSAPEGDAVVWEMPEISYVQGHRYANGDWADHASEWVRTYRTQFSKPVLIGEFGLLAKKEHTPRLDPGGVHLHNAIWAATMAGSAGTAMTWWWDAFVHERDLYHHFHSLSRFFREVDWTQGFRPLESYELGFTPGSGAAFGSAFLEGREAAWEPAPFNEPRTFNVSPAGELDTPELLSRALHGIGHHSDLHNPQTFLVEYPTDGEFQVLVRGVSGWGGANLKVFVDGEMRLEREFPEVGGPVEVMRRYNGLYRVEVPAGQRRIQVLNDGADWLYAAYVLKDCTRLARPNVRVLGLTGSKDTLVWLRHADFRRRRVVEFEFKPSPLGRATLLLPEVVPGHYEVIIWDTWRGREISRRRREIGPATALELPKFAEALAVRLCRVRD